MTKTTIKQYLLIDLHNLFGEIAVSFLTKGLLQVEQGLEA